MIKIYYLSHIQTTSRHETLSMSQAFVILLYVYQCHANLMDSNNPTSKDTQMSISSINRRYHKIFTENSPPKRRFATSFFKKP